jgi:hypothetical protein
MKRGRGPVLFTGPQSPGRFHKFSLLHREDHTSFTAMASTSDHRCHARIVSGLAMVATSSSTCFPSFLPIAARVFRALSLGRKQPRIC